MRILLALSISHLWSDVVVVICVCVRDLIVFVPAHLGYVLSWRARAQTPRPVHFKFCISRRISLYYLPFGFWLLSVFVYVFHLALLSHFVLLLACDYLQVKIIHKHTSERSTSTEHVCVLLWKLLGPCAVTSPSHSSKNVWNCCLFSEYFEFMTGMDTKQATKQVCHNDHTLFCSQNTTSTEFCCDSLCSPMNETHGNKLFTWLCADAREHLSTCITTTTSLMIIIGILVYKGSERAMDRCVTESAFWISQILR